MSYFPDVDGMRRSTAHIHSADMFASASPVQMDRSQWRPVLPDAFKSTLGECHEEEFTLMAQKDPEELSAALPNIFKESQYVEIRPLAGATPSAKRRPIRVGIILSGGPAPGGHNVIAGMFDYIRRVHPDSQLYGFIGGLDGAFKNKYKVVTPELMNKYRNTGGFDMLWSGRGRVNGDADLETLLSVSKQLQLTGLVVVGGDGSNSNAALMADYMKAHNGPSVVGVPKTIDGDLRNDAIETTFGFDTAARTYAELIGNLCTDVATAGHCYHFVRVMGRSASHLVLECAMHTRPNLCLVGEEVKREKLSLKQITSNIVDMILQRSAVHKKYGVVLLPEGLIEFVPEMELLIDQLNKIVAALGTSVDVTDFNVMRTTIRGQLSDANREVWDFLPESIQEQLMSDREATGYVQVAKIATEKLLIMLVQRELRRRGYEDLGLSFMPHYFGYEGRCAMPSNFDANYCYALGATAACLVQHDRSGYMAIIRGLQRPASQWLPCGVPIVRMMQMFTGVDGSRYPGVSKSLVDLDGPLFKIFQDTRKSWVMRDVYSIPGPIQFSGPNADAVPHMVQVPTKEELEGFEAPEAMKKRANFAKDERTMSALQRERIKFRPLVPEICFDPKARCRAVTACVPKDPYTLRQTLTYYPSSSNNHQFMVQEVSHDKYTPPVAGGLRVGVVILSRQAPGIANVLWGLQERMALVGGSLFGFFGIHGLLNQRYVEITEEDLKLYKNLGGMEFLGRSLEHSMAEAVNLELTRRACLDLKLDGLVIVGSAHAMTEASILSEYLMQKECSTCVVGIPATGSNNVGHELLECCLGFDSTTKVYASLIGNVLTDAASMPKYWHFIRLMGRDPSFEVMECSLQTHPNFVLIAEEYGAADKTLNHIVNDICDVICQRAKEGKNFGTVIIPEGLLGHLPNMKNLVIEINSALEEATKQGRAAELEHALVHMEDNQESEWSKMLTPWSLALFRTFPKFIRREFLSFDSTELKFTHIETEELLAQMVKKELENRRLLGNYVGKFQAVRHYFGYQGRSSLPSIFDCQLGLTHGFLAAILIESGLTGYCTTVRGLCGDARKWKLGGIPLTSMMRVVPVQDVFISPTASLVAKTDRPVLPSVEVKLDSKAFRWLKASVQEWALNDHFCNPGPIQYFGGRAAMSYSRVLHEEQAEYLQMLQMVEFYTFTLQRSCSFGVDEHFLKTAFTMLNSLLALRLHGDNLIHFGIPIPDHYLSSSANQNMLPSHAGFLTGRASGQGLFSPTGAPLPGFFPAPVSDPYEKGVTVPSKEEAWRLVQSSERRTGGAAAAAANRQKAEERERNNSTYMSVTNSPMPHPSPSPAMVHFPGSGFTNLQL